MVGYLSKKPKLFLWMIQENFTGKGDVQHNLKGWKPYSKVKLEGSSKSPRESPPPRQDAGRPSNQEEDGEDGDRESCCIRQDQRTKPACEDQKK
jgi:hypothetical protein